MSTQDASAVAITGGTITGLTAPTADTDAATKAYVDGHPWKAPVLLATTAAGTLATSFAAGQAVDSNYLTVGDRILVKDQTTSAENGIYVVNATGAPTRATDADSGAELVSAAVFVQSGNVNHDRAWVQTTDGPLTLGTSSIVWTDFPTAIGSTTKTYVDAADSAIASQLTNYAVKSQNLADLTNLATARANLSLGSAALLASSAFDAAGLAAAAAAASQPLDSDLTAIAALTTTAYGRAFLALVNQAGLVALLPGYQPLDATNLSAIAALTTTAYGRALLTLANQAALLALLPNTGSTAGRVHLPIFINAVAMAGGTTAAMTTIAAGLYKEIRVRVRTAGGMVSGAWPTGAVGLRFNGDTGANYDSQCLYVGGSNTQLGASAGQLALTGSVANVDTFSLDLSVSPLVTSSLPRSFTGIWVSRNSGGGGMISGTTGGYWNNTGSGLTDMGLVFTGPATGSVEFSGVPA